MEWKEVTLGDFMQCNPKRTIKKGQKARKITMDLLIPHSKTIRNWNYEPYSGGAKFQNGDTIMARITPCLENGKHAFVSILNKGEIAYGSTEYFVFCGKENVSDDISIPSTVIDSPILSGSITISPRKSNFRDSLPYVSLI